MINVKSGVEHLADKLEVGPSSGNPGSFCNQNCHQIALKSYPTQLQIRSFKFVPRFFLRVPPRSFKLLGSPEDKTLDTKTTALPHTHQNSRLSCPFTLHPSPFTLRQAHTFHKTQNLKLCLLQPINVEQEAVVMTDSTVVEVLAQCEAKLMRLMDSVEGDQATQELEAQVKFLDPQETVHARFELVG